MKRKLRKQTAPLWLLGMVVGMALSGGVAVAQGPANVRVAPVEHKSGVTPVLNFVGTVLPARRSTIGSAVDGRVEQYLIEAGQEVEAGEELARILRGTIDIEIRVAEADRDARRAELEELEAGARPEELARAEAQLSAAEALAEYSRSRMERAQRLAQQPGVLSADELELSVSDYRTAEQKVAEMRESLALLRAGARQEQIAQAQARLAVAEETVNLLNDRRNKYTLRSPFKGYVVREFTEIGAWVREGDPIAEVVEIQTVEVEVHVPERVVPHLTMGQQVPIQLDAIPGEQFSGTIARIVPDADTRGRTFPVRITVPNEPEEDHRLLRPGMLARATLPSGRAVDGLTVPKDAVVLGGLQPVVFKNDNGVARQVPVELVVESFDRFVVQGALREGDEVVIRGNERLRPDAEIQVLSVETP